MFRLKHVGRAATALCAGGFAFAAAAQQQAEGTQKLERIEVTGSRIKRVDAETPAPVQVITRDAIERSGAMTVTELLKSLPANSTGAFDENAIASFSPGAGGVSLRGLGAQATLVLINGRRVTPYGFAHGGQQTFVDVNSIPLDAVERIDILLDGASALYGSDAMAGVVNVILRKDFTGFRTHGSIGQTSYGDGTSTSAGFTVGSGSLDKDRYNVFASYEHSEREAIKASERPNTRSADFRRFGLTDRRSSYSMPGNLYGVSGTAEGTFLGPVAGCTPLDDPTSPVNGQCVYDQVRYQDIQSATTRDHLVMGGVAELDAQTQLFADAIFTRSTIEQGSPSYNTSTYFSTGTLPQEYIPLSATHPQNSFGQEVGLRYRFGDVPNTTTTRNDTQRATLGVRTALAEWDVESAVVYSRSKTSNIYTGYLRDSVLLNEVLDPNTGMARDTFVFGNPAANDAGLMARLYPTLRDTGLTSMGSLDVHGSRQFGRLAGGPMGIALGADFRHETFRTTPDPLVAAGEISVLGAAAADGERNVSAFFAELSAPFLKTLETQFAVRVDRYSDFGSATTPKVGLKWKPVSNLALRGTYSKGFRAPSLVENSGTPVTSFYSDLRDPQLCPDPVGAPNANCNVTVAALQGANKDLKAETSKSVTVGLVFDPTDNLTVSLDFYRIKRLNEISTMEPDYLLAHESEYPGYVQRDPATGQIQRLNLPLTNLGSTLTRGYDIDVKNRWPLGELGTLTLAGTYNRTPHYRVRPVADAEELDYAGTYMQPKERYTFGGTWEYGVWTTSLKWNYVGGYSRAFSPSDAVCPYESTTPDLCRVASWMTADAFVGYTGIKNLALGLTVQNIDNRQAPLDERAASDFTLYRSAFHNQLGRFISVSARYTFW